MNKLSRLGVRQLRIFSALLKHGNLSHVADQMGLTQQAVSANLATLRDVFGDPLFTRTARGVVPTALATELGAEVSSILDSMTRLVDRAPFDPARVAATVNISAADYSHRVAITPHLHAIRARAPQLRLVLSELAVEALAGKMAAGEIDIAVSIPEYVPESFPRRVLFHEHYVCVTARGSPLTRRKTSLKEVAQHPHVVVSPARPNLIGSADTWFQRLGVQRDIVLSVPHFLLVPEVVEAMGAVAFLPSRLLPDARLATVCLEGEPSPPGFEQIAAWHPRSESSPLIHWLVDMLAREA